MAAADVEVDYNEGCNNIVFVIAFARGIHTVWLIDNQNFIW